MLMSKHYLIHYTKSRRFFPLKFEEESISINFLYKYYPHLKNIYEQIIQNKYKSSHHPLRSARPCHTGSVRTIRSMSFFHSMPSEMTRYHSLHTSSAAHRDRASRYDRIDSAMWSRPLAAMR